MTQGHATFIDQGDLLTKIAKKVSRLPDGLCLKICYRTIFKEKPDIKKVNWCTSPFKFFDCTRLQNICAYEGLAPRVYDIGYIPYENGYALYQLQDYVGEGEGENEQVWKRCVVVVEKYGAKVLLKEEKGGVWNSAGGKRVGFKSFGFEDYILYENIIKSYKKLRKTFKPKIYQQTKNKIIYECEGYGQKKILYDIDNYNGDFNNDYILI